MLSGRWHSKRALQKCRVFFLFKSCYINIKEYLYAKLLNKMKKLLTVLLIFTAFGMSAQDRFQAFAEVTAYNLKEYNYTLDVNYTVTDNFSISSWNTITTGRSEAQGFNYSVKSILFNWSDKKRNVVSVGYGEINQIHYKFNNEAFIVKLRVKLF